MMTPINKKQEPHRMKFYKLQNNLIAEDNNLKRVFAIGTINNGTLQPFNCRSGFKTAATNLVGVGAKVLNKQSNPGAIELKQLPNGSVSIDIFAEISLGVQVANVLQGSFRLRDFVDTSIPTQSIPTIAPNTTMGSTAAMLHRTKSQAKLSTAEVKNESDDNCFYLMPESDDAPDPLANTKYREKASTRLKSYNEQIKNLNIKDEDENDNTPGGGGHSKIN